MNTIFICGAETDWEISSVLITALSQYGGVQYYSGTEMRQFGTEKNLQFLLYEGEAVPDNRGSTGLLLFKRSFHSVKPVVGEWIPILESDNLRAAQVLRGTGLPTITCGTSRKDTLSVASMDFPQATVSLLRDVTTLGGKVIEPCEISILLRRTVNPTQLLACTASLLLSDVELENGFIL